MTLSDYGLIVTIIAGIASTILSIVALNISHKTFQRQKTFENENHYYEYKFKTYVSILKKMVDYLNFVDTQVFETFEKFKNKEVTEEYVEKSADIIDKKADMLQDELASLVAFLPQNITQQIDKVLDLIYGNALGDDISQDEYNATQDALNKIADEMDVVERIMIEDIGIDIIHNRLKRRIKEA